MKRIKVFLVSCIFFVLCAFGFSACKKGGEVTCTLLSVTDTQVVIRVDETDGKAVLLNAMEKLQSKGELTFTVSGGMVTAINGVENDTTNYIYWMLYTSDSEMSNAAWGTVEYDGQTLGSAALGAEDLIVAKDAIYIWKYGF